MVTAGVYLLMRTSPLIEYSSTVLVLCLWIGAITTVFSSLIGLFQQDIKKVIAYSTMSQLGIMVIAVGLSSYNLAIFHLVNHAFYKGLLFLGAGAVIHAWADNQDFRKYGGLRPFLPLTYSVMLIASLSLVAFPFMTGFYSKDFILESTYGQFYFSSTVIYFIATIGAMFTTLYSVKVLYLTFLTNPNGPLISYKQVHEGDIFMSIPLIILALFSIFFGYLTNDIFVGLGSSFFADNSLFIHPTHEILLDTEFAVPSLFKLLPLIFTISLTAISIVISEFFSNVLISFKFSRFGYNIFSFFNQRFLIELFYNKYITGNIFKLGGQTTKVLDKGSVELVGPFGLEKLLVSLSKNISSLDTGVTTSYALYILIGLIFYLLIPYIWLTDSSLLLLIMFSLSITIDLNENKTSNNLDFIYDSRFVTQPLQSSFTPTWVTKHFTPKKLFILMGAFTFSLTIRLIFKEFDMVMFIQSDVLFCICSFITIFTSSLIRAYLELYIPDINWYSVYNFIISSYSSKCETISKFLYIITSGKGDQAMYTGVKSTILEESPKPNNVLFTNGKNQEVGSATTDNQEQGSATTDNQEQGSAISVQEGKLKTFQLVLNDVRSKLDNYSVSLGEFCFLAFDLNIDLNNLKSEFDALKEQDTNYKIANKKLLKKYRALSAESRTNIPVSEQDLYKVDPVHGLPTTKILEFLYGKASEIQQMEQYLYDKYGESSQAALKPLIDNRMLDSEDYAKLERLHRAKSRYDTYWRGLGQVNSHKNSINPTLRDLIPSDTFKINVR